jgi:hypothetical protein
MGKMLLRLLVAACVCAAAPLAQARSAPSLESALRAASALRWAEARSEVEAVLRAGGLDRETVLRAYELRAETTAVLDGVDASEREYRKLLSLDPAHSPPRRRSPVFMMPYERARRWANDSGALRIAHTPPATLPTGVPTTLTVELNDPLMLAGAVRRSVSRASCRSRSSRRGCPSWRLASARPIGSRRSTARAMFWRRSGQMSRSASWPWPPVFRRSQPRRRRRW